MSALHTASFVHYGVAPFEVEALYSILNGVFIVKEQKSERPDDGDVACMIEIDFPLEFNDDFFESFGRKRWDTLTFLIKEMRRRTGKKGVCVMMRFAGKPVLSFKISMHAENLFEQALEKMAVLAELVELQTGSGKIPYDVDEVRYEFDEERTKWLPRGATANGTSYAYDNGEWVAGGFTTA